MKALICSISKTPPWRRLAGVIVALAFSGCVNLIAPYDETTDRLLTDLTVRTEASVAKADAGQLSDKERDDFYAEAQGAVQTMEMRAGLYQKNDKETKALADLAQRYLDLQKRHARPFTSLSTGLRATLLDLHQIEAAKKRSTAFSNGLKNSAAASVP